MIFIVSKKQNKKTKKVTGNTQEVFSKKAMARSLSV